MSSVVQFRRRTPRRVRIVAERQIFFRYTVLLEEVSPFVALQIFELDDARASATSFSNT
jgi:hypothetical protein